MAESVVETDPAELLNAPNWMMGRAELTFDLADASDIVSLTGGTSCDGLAREDAPVSAAAVDPSLPSGHDMLDLSHEQRFRTELTDQGERLTRVETILELRLPMTD